MNLMLNKVLVDPTITDINTGFQGLTLRKKKHTEFIQSNKKIKQNRPHDRSGIELGSLSASKRENSS